MNKIPNVTCAYYFDPCNLFFVSFIDQENKIFEINGFSKGGVKFNELPKSYKSNFVVNQIAVGIHKVSQELIAIFCGESQIHIVFID